MSCGLFIEADQLVELVKQYNGYYKECATSRAQCVLEKLEQTTVQECQKQDTKEKVNNY